jgi:hypothetical protein
MSIFCSVYWIDATMLLQCPVQLSPREREGYIPPFQGYIPRAEGNNSLFPFVLFLW